MNDLKRGEKAAGMATLATVFLCLSKGIVGVITGSLLLIADAVHSGIDIIAIFASWFGLKIAQRKPTEKFPYGFYKAENLATLFISAFIFYASYEIFMQSYTRLFESSEFSIPLLALGVSLGSSGISYIIAKYEEKVGREINSQSLIANSQESKMDVASSLIVFLGLLLSYYKVPYIEAAIGIMLSLLILKIALQTAKASVYALMDASPDTELEQQVRNTILASAGIKKVRTAKLRQSGPFVFGEAKIEVSKYLSVKRSHELAEEVEKRLRHKYPKIESFILHVEPAKETRQKVVIPVTEDRGINSKITGNFGRASHFLFIEMDGNVIVNAYIKKNPYVTLKSKAGLAAVKKLSKENIDAVILQSIGEISFHVMRDKLIDIYKTQGKTAKRVIQNLIKGELKILERPTNKK